MLKRNEEVHTSDLPFATMREGQWLPHYYEACGILNESVGETLESYFGEEEARTASEMIDIRKSKKRTDIKKRIKEHREEFQGKSETERDMLQATQKTAATGWQAPATTRECPACRSQARLVGTLEGTSEPMFRDGSFVLEQRFLANELTCGACALKLRNIEELMLGNVDFHYNMVVQTDLHEFYEPEDINGYMNM